MKTWKIFKSLLIFSSMKKRKKIRESYFNAVESKFAFEPDFCDLIYNQINEFCDINQSIAKQKRKRQKIFLLLVLSIFNFHPQKNGKGRWKSGWGLSWRHKVNFQSGLVPYLSRFSVSIKLFHVLLLHCETFNDLFLAFAYLLSQPQKFHRLSWLQ